MLTNSTCIERIYAHMNVYIADGAQSSRRAIQDAVHKT